MQCILKNNEHSYNHMYRQRRKIIKKTMQKIGLPKLWYEVETFCTKIHRSITAPIGLSL